MTFSFRKTACATLLVGASALPAYAQTPNSSDSSQVTGKEVQDKGAMQGSSGMSTTGGTGAGMSGSGMSGSGSSGMSNSATDGQAAERLPGHQPSSPSGANPR